MDFKQLLSEVLGEEVTFIYEELDEYNMLHYVVNNCKCRTNIYELAHKVKEWAFDNKYIITCSPLITELKWKKHSVRLTHFYLASKDRAIYDEFGSNGRIEANTEVEAIFKAGEWVLKELNYDRL